MRHTLAAHPTSSLAMELKRSRGTVPARALLLSFAALAVPLYGSFFSPEAASDYELLLWLLALVPAFLFAYYRGWSGATFALAIGMGVLALTQIAVLLSGRTVQNWPLLLMVVAVYICIALGIGWISELLHRERARAEGLALLDELTGLPNRRYAQITLDREFAAARRGRQLAVVLFDLDHFKRFNDTHGHAAGDDVLRAFGRVLQQNTRQMNLSARYGGEEFLSVLSDTDAEGALGFVARVRAAVGELSLPYGKVTVSAGVSVCSSSTESVEELLAAADRALYQAKDGGRDRVAVARAPANA